MPLYVFLSFILAIAGGSLIYLGARNQVLIPANTLRWELRLAGIAALIISLVIMLQWFGPAAAIFTWVTAAMLAWSIVPFVAVWRPRNIDGKEGRKKDGRQ